jgi:aerobic-type carbon monoxide dehydrogenase small subunit (CoxS/CutS family)
LPRYRINGKEHQLDHPDGVRLLWLLRDHIGLTGTKFGCGESMCGACTVLIDGKPRRSCTIPASSVQNSEITTIESLARGNELHPVQEAFIQHDAFQCGFCTAGMIMATVGLLKKNPQPTEAEIRNALEGNVCRCCAYSRIVDAVKDASVAMRGAK